MTRLKDGETGIIISINALTSHGHAHRQRHGWSPTIGHGRTFKKRLEDLGLTPGTKVTVVKSAPFQGPVELRVRGATLALGRGMAERIIVRKEG